MTELDAIGVLIDKMMKQRVLVFLQWLKDNKYSTTSEWGMWWHEDDPENKNISITELYDKFNQERK